MQNKKVLPILLAVLVVAVLVFVFVRNQPVEENPKTDNITADENGRRMEPTTTAEQPTGKLKVANFSGKLEEVNTGCFSDGECYVVVGGKHITTIMGWSQAIVGSVQGVEGFGDLEKNIGQEIEVYAQDKGDGTYTLYGSEGFYVKLK